MDLHRSAGVSSSAARPSDWQTCCLWLSQWSHTAITWTLAALVLRLQQMHRWIFAALGLPFKELSRREPALSLQREDAHSGVPWQHLCSHGLGDAAVHCLKTRIGGRLLGELSFLKPRAKPRHLQMLPSVGSVVTVWRLPLHPIHEAPALNEVEALASP